MRKEQIAIAVELDQISITVPITGQVIDTIRVDVDSVALEIARNPDIATAVGCYPIATIPTATANILSKNQIAIAVELDYIRINLPITGQVIDTIRVNIDGFLEKSCN